MTAKFAFLALGTVGLSVFCAVLGDQVVKRDNRKDRVTIIYWEKWTGAEGEAMRKVVNDFNASQNRIFVNYLSISGIDQKTMLATAGGNPPDVAGIWDNQVAQFANAGALTDLTPMANDAGLNRDYYIHAYYDDLNVKGHLYALPSTPASIALYVRPDLVPPEFATPETFPKTLEGLDVLSQKISKTKPDGSLVLAGFLPSNPGWWNWAWGAYFGGHLMENGVPSLDTPRNIEAFKWIAGYAKRFGAHAVQSFQSGFGNFSSPQDPFMEGKVASELNGTWKANYIKVYHPGLPWFAVPFPYPEKYPELAGHGNLSQDVLAIPRSAKHVKEAFEFIQFVQRQDVMEGLCSSHGKNSPLQRVSEEFFKNHPNKFIRLFDQLARSPKAITIPITGFYPQLGAELDNAFQQVNTGIKTPEAALHDAQVRVLGLYQTYHSQVDGP
jgi:ABC-type glycerol-3-phosphate transport system substrate-binding protein